MVATSWRRVVTSRGTGDVAAMHVSTRRPHACNWREAGAPGPHRVIQQLCLADETRAWAALPAASRVPGGSPAARASQQSLWGTMLAREISSVEPRGRSVQRSDGLGVKDARSRSASQLRCRSASFARASESAKTGCPHHSATARRVVRRFATMPRLCCICGY